MRSKQIPTIEGDMVYLPSYKIGTFYGWVVLDVKYFSKEQLQSIEAALLAVTEAE